MKMDLEPVPRGTPRGKAGQPANALVPNTRPHPRGQGAGIVHPKPGAPRTGPRSAGPSGGQGFGRAERLRRRAEYLETSRTAQKRLRTGHFLILVRNNHLGWTRIGITVTRKIGNAVVRNRIKRQVREFFRVHKQRIETGRDLVVIAQRGADTLNHQALWNELGALTARSADPKP